MAKEFLKLRFFSFWQNDIKMLLIWHKNVTNMTLKLLLNDIKMTLKWQEFVKLRYFSFWKNATRMSLKWHKNDIKMTQKWHRNDT